MAIEVLIISGSQSVVRKDKDKDVAWVAAAYGDFQHPEGDMDLLPGTGLGPG